jgi:hypothetical protein
MRSDLLEAPIERATGPRIAGVVTRHRRLAAEACCVSIQHDLSPSAIHLTDFRKNATSKSALYGRISTITYPQISSDLPTYPREICPTLSFSVRLCADWDSGRTTQSDHVTTVSAPRDICLKIT